MARKFEYDDEESRKTERSYLAPEVVRQRMRTLEVLNPRTGEHIIDVGCGPGLLAYDLAIEVGAAGRIVGVDNSPSMIALAEDRCAGLPQVKFVKSEAAELPAGDESVDAATCTQVLLYIEEVNTVLSEIRRVLKPGGRVVVVETDWRSAVINSIDPELTENMIATWDRLVASPNLPVRLGSLLRQHGFTAVNTEAFPILSTDRTAEGYSATMTEQFARLAVKQNLVSEAESQAWLEDLERLGSEGAYFFCVNRFLFSAVKT